VRQTAEAQALSLPAGPTKSIRITLQSLTSGKLGTTFGISNLVIPGVIARRTLDVPDVGSPNMLAFDAAPGFRSGCLDIGGQPSCDGDTMATGEEDYAIDRTFQLTGERRYIVNATVRVLLSQAVEEQLDSRLTIRATASSVASGDPRVRPSAAVDGDLTTAWSAAAGDAQPWLALSWKQPRTLHGIRIATSSDSPVAAPDRVRIDVANQRWEGQVPKSGSIDFGRSLKANSLKITVLSSGLRTSVSTLTGRTRLLPAGINAVSLDDGALSSSPSLPRTISIGCADGLAMTLDGQRIPLQVRAPSSAVLKGDPVTATSCGSSAIDVPAGKHHVALEHSKLLAPLALTLATGVSLSWPSTSAGTFHIARWQPSERRVGVAASAPAFLVVRENYNAGWQATLNGKRLKAVRVDGWQQAFEIPAGSVGTVDLNYGPQRTFVVGLGIGGASILGLFAMFCGSSGHERQSRLAEKRPKPVWLIALLALAVLQLSGPAGVMTLLVVIALKRAFWPAPRRIPSWLPATTLIGASFRIATAPPLERFSVSNSGETQLLCVAALCLVALGGFAPPNRPPAA
jgi:arabinofuranan 3-O-arabinosyltransferase